MQNKRFLTLTLAILLIFTLLQIQSFTKAVFALPADDIIVTGVIDGPLTGGIPKAIELYVVNDIPDLSIYGIGSANNGGGSDGEEFTFPADSASAGDFLYVASEETQFNTFFGFNPDYTSSAANINGDDAIELFTNGSVSDVFGDIDVDGTGEDWEYMDGWAYRNDNSGPDGSAFSLVNWGFSGKNALDGESSNGTAANPFPIGTYSPGAVIDNPPTVDSTSPIDSATNVVLDTNIDINFSEDVTVTGNWFEIVCVTSGTHTVADTVVSGSPTSYTINPDTDFSLSESCTVTVYAAQVADQDGTIDQMAADYNFSFTTAGPADCSATDTLISVIQGSGSASPENGNIHTIQGIVVGDFQDDNINGFFVQEEDTDADANPLTSEGIFVYEGGSVVSVAMGDEVQVIGTVDEYNTLTELTTVTDVQVCSSGNSMPTAGILTLPLLAADALEQYEGMRVTTSQTWNVTNSYFLGQGGALTLSYNGRLPQPTQIAAPGAAANAQQAANDLNQIILDDGSFTRNPDPVVYPAPSGLSASNTSRGGDEVSNIVGVLTYGYYGWSGSGDAYRIHSTQDPTFTSVNARPTSAPDVQGTLQVASFNVLNYFNTFSGCTGGVSGAAMDCRGADNSTEFNRQRDKIIDSIVTMDADVIGLMEIENDGYGVSSAIADLVSGLNTIAGVGTYAYVDVDTQMSTTDALGTDAIKVGLLYKPGTVSLAGNTAVLDSSVDVNFIDSKNRPVLIQSFTETATGETFTVAVNHLKSKGSNCDALGDSDAGDGQGNCNLTRKSAAQALVGYLATDPTTVSDTDYLIIGDLNSYAMEDPIVAIETALYTNLVSYFGGTYGYSYGGQWGTLDYALSSSSLTPFVTNAEEWHINADEPIALDYNTNFKSAGQIISLYSADEYRASDHDPVLVGLDLAQLIDFSSLDSGYGIAWHSGDGVLRLGSSWDSDKSYIANGDIGTDDSVVRGTGSGSGGQWQPGADGGSLDITIVPDGGNYGCLYAWIDWDGDGVFADPSERVIDAQTDGRLNYSFTVPDNEFLPPGTSGGSNQFYNARVRLYGACSSGPTGAGTGGEVEDYTWEFTPTAVSLQSFAGNNHNNSLIVLIVMALALVGGTAVLRYRKQI